MCMLNIAFSNVMIAVKKAKDICAEILIEISGRKANILQDGVSRLLPGRAIMLCEGEVYN